MPRIAASGRAGIVGTVRHDESASHGYLAPGVNRGDPRARLFQISVIELPVGTEWVDFDVLQFIARRPGHNRRSISVGTHVRRFDVFDDDPNLPGGR